MNGTPEDPSKPQRQQTFIRALETLDGVTVHYGSFLTNRVYMPRANRLPGQSRKVEVIKTEEKGSDVNLASMLLSDAFRGEFEAAIVLSNDSDLVLPIKIVTEELGLPVGLLNPHERFSVDARASPRSRRRSGKASFATASSLTSWLARMATRCTSRRGGSGFMRASRAPVGASLRPISADSSGRAAGGHPGTRRTPRLSGIR